jgi:predicted Ser/Thr protein kinase
MEFKDDELMELKMPQLNNDMYACGRKGLPEVIFCCQQTWQLELVFKHDFFACTGLYVSRDSNQRCVLKVSRLESFLAIPGAWIGRFLRNRELNILKQLDGIDQVPKFLSTYGRNGLVYEYIEGESLDERPTLADNYFLLLNQLLEKIHARNICYLDMNKRGNILIGKDGRPYLIDFQISLFLPGRIFSGIRKLLQNEDFYHLLKHKRRLRPDLMRQAEWKIARRTSLLIKLHRSVGNPFRWVRRGILRYLYRKQILTCRSHMLSTPENDHQRFL